MPPPHLLLEPARDRLRVELPALLADHDLEREVEQQVAELVAQRGGVAVRERLIELEDLFDEIRTQRLGSLGAVPGTAGSEIAHERESAGESGIGVHRVSSAVYLTP